MSTSLCCGDPHDPAQTTASRVSTQQNAIFNCWIKLRVAASFGSTKAPVSTSLENAPSLLLDQRDLGDDRLGAGTGPTRRNDRYGCSVAQRMARLQRPEKRGHVETKKARIGSPRSPAMEEIHG